MLCFQFQRVAVFEQDISFYYKNLPLNPKREKLFL